ncbi:MAG: DUF4249 domain-containing protein [Bacteroidales bacterium]|jgi:hypothetical protein|nr:DUF4249 domain-containing protein [Bacteroidales bacterium]
MKALQRLFLSGCCIVAACSESIDLRLRGADTRMLVVEGHITSDTMAHGVWLSYTADYFDLHETPVENVQVTITDGDLIIPLTEVPDTAGLFRTAPDIFGLPGHTYKLLITGVDADGDGTPEEYRSESTMPGAGKIDSIRLMIQHIYFTDALIVSFFAHEPTTADDAYLFKIRYNNVLVTDTIFEWMAIDDTFFPGTDINNEPIFFLDQEKPEYHITDGDTVTLETWHIPRDYYDFVNDAVQEYRGASPFSGYPANIRTNITGDRKAWGIWAASYIYRRSRVWEEEPSKK